MTTDRKIVFYHAPNSRSGGTLLLLEELGAPYEMRVLNLNKNEQRAPAYLAINPMGKVPAIVHGDALITEQIAIYMYLADLFPEAKLAPPIGDPLRGPYLRWMAFYAGCFEPAISDRALKRDPAPPRMIGYGDYETTIKTIDDQLAKGPYLLGERLTAADILWGAGLRYGAMFKLVPETPAIMAFVKRMGERPATARMRAKDAELAAAQAA